jgi:hypothetical protein
MVRKSIFYCLSLVFYGYLLGNAPDSLDYLIVKIHDQETSPGSEDYGEDTKYFLSEQVYSLEENQWEITTYSYAKNSPNSATLNIFHDGGTTQTVWNLTFSSENSASGTWTEVEETVTYSGTTSFNIIDAGYAPEEIAGKAIIYTEGAESETATFSSDGKVYGDKEGEWTYYTYEKLSANAGKVLFTFENEQNPLPEKEILFFTAVGAGIFEWSEYSDATMSTVTEKGTGTFSVSVSENYNLAVRPRSIWASRDLVYLQTPTGPIEIEGAGEIDLGAELIEHPSVTQLNLSVNGNSYDLMQKEAPAGFRTRFDYESGNIELFDLESTSDSDWTAYANQTTFAFSLTVDGSEYSYSHNLPAESELPQPANVSFNGDYSWKKDTDGYDYVEILKNNSYQFSWDTFSSTDSKDYILVHVQELVGDDDVQVMPEVVLDAGETSYTVNGSYFEAGKKYSFYVELKNVTEQQNPSGFAHASGSDTSLPLLQTTARMVTVLDLVVSDKKVAVSDPSGNPVVVQLGEEYKWNDSLDGVTLWSVSGSESEGDWDALTAKFSGGKLIYGFEFADDVSDTGANTAPYEIDENGYIKSLEGDGDYQYYNVVSVEDGVIGTIQNDQGVESVADNGVNQVDQWFFTTRADAEEFYYSKVNPKSWMWFDAYPWVYSEEENDWLYFHPSGGSLMYWSNKGQAWRKFN